jgi:GNAT superfamily N-acetyltransferase
MANTEALDIATLRPDHVEGALALSAEAGWNQTAEDWRLMIARGHAIGVEDEHGTLIASALVFPYEDDIAWISMVLVTPAWQRKGLASRLMTECLTWTASRGITALLDATPVGAGVYRMLGFETVRRMARWQRLSKVTPAPASKPVADAELENVVALDRRATGCGRKFLLADIMQRDDCIALGSPKHDGFALSRAGRIATQLGPITAQSPETAIELFDAVLSRIDGPVFIDAFDDQTAFKARLQERGFEIQRTFERMVKGPRRDIREASLSFAAAGPEFG